MFTLSPATAHSSLAVSPSGTIMEEGSPVMVSSPGAKEEALSATLPVPPNLCHLGPATPALRTAPYPEL